MADALNSMGTWHLVVLECVFVCVAGDSVSVIYQTTVKVLDNDK